MHGFEALYNLYTPENLSLKDYLESLDIIISISNKFNGSIRDRGLVGVLYLNPEDRLIKAATDCYFEGYDLKLFETKKTYKTKLFEFELSDVFKHAKNYVFTNSSGKEPCRCSNYGEIIETICYNGYDEKEKYPFDSEQLSLFPYWKRQDGNYVWNVFVNSQDKFGFTGGSRLLGRMTVS